MITPDALASMDRDVVVELRRAVKAFDRALALHLAKMDERNPEARRATPRRTDSPALDQERDLV